MIHNFWKLRPSGVKEAINILEAYMPKLVTIAHSTELLRDES